MKLLDMTPKGLFCPAADVYIDPNRKVEKAVITHGHADHARRGHASVLTSASGSGIVRRRIGPKPRMQTLAFGEKRKVGDAVISLHPAGHILGSAQIRIEVDGKVAVVTGDYNRGRDPTCESFEPVPCDLLVSETTFGLPVYQWPDPEENIRSINDWWRQNQQNGLNSVLLGYSLGKAQRLLAMLDPETGPVFVHGAQLPFLAFYRQAGIRLPYTRTFKVKTFLSEQGKALLLISPGAFTPALKKKLGKLSTGFASGWTLTGGPEARVKYDRGFPVSDHADWPGIVQTVEECQPEEIWTVHGYTVEVSRHFRAQGYKTLAF